MNICTNYFAYNFGLPESYISVLMTRYTFDSHHLPPKCSDYHHHLYIAAVKRSFRKKMAIRI